MSREVIEKFYEAFSKGDWKTMASVYAPDAKFTDGAFRLQGPQIGNMWRMLVERASDLKLEHSDVTDNTAHWEAWYTFGATGRKVHNVIDAKFEFNADGLVTKHEDRFVFWNFARQALGPAGAALGWAPFFQAAFRKRAMATLAEFESTLRDAN